MQHDTADGVQALLADAFCYQCEGSTTVVIRGGMVRPGCGRGVRLRGGCGGCVGWGWRVFEIIRKPRGEGQVVGVREAVAAGS